MAWRTLWGLLLGNIFASFLLNCCQDQNQEFFIIPQWHFFFFFFLDDSSLHDMRNGKKKKMFAQLIKISPSQTMTNMLKSLWLIEEHNSSRNKLIFQSTCSASRPSSTRLPFAKCAVFWGEKRNHNNPQCESEVELFKATMKWKMTFASQEKAAS